MTARHRDVAAQGVRAGAERLVLQLRKNHVDQVILAGMSANLSVEAHLRELLEQGFEVGVVKKGHRSGETSGRRRLSRRANQFPLHPNAVWTTDQVVKMMTA